MDDIEALGWSEAWAEVFSEFEEQGLEPARVAVQHQHLYDLYTRHGELMAQVSGRFRHRAPSRVAYPVAGDWVAIRPRPAERQATIQAVLPRKSLVSRQAAGDETLEQPLAANIDIVFLTMGLDGDFNPRRLERYLAVASKSGAETIALLTKPDLCPEAEERRKQVESMGSPALVLSPKSGEGVEALTALLRPRRTVALLGSSGVGKSTLINRLLGEERLKTREVRLSDDRGRHTTTRRELIVLPSGALVIDTPGMRELQLGETAEAGSAFTDIDELGALCRFADCRHEKEPGCAVQLAAQEGRLSEERLESFRKLKREMAHQEVRVDMRARAEEKRRWKIIHKAMRQKKPRT